MKKTVYIETSIPSLYYETRKDVISRGWRETTRIWWHQRSNYYQMLTSAVVYDELNTGNHPFKVQKLALIEHVEYLEHLPIIDDIAEFYIKNKLVPEETGGDAYHLAYASYYDVSFLLTWNCSHLANPNKFQHIHTVNARLNLSTPILCTPEQLLAE